MRRARYHALVAAGCCVGCKQPHPGPLHRCDRCRAIKSVAEKARRSARVAAGLVKPKGWNGLQARKHAIYKRSSEECRSAGATGGAAAGEARFVRSKALAVREARAALADMRRELCDNHLTVAAIEVLHQLYERAYELGYAKGWKRARRHRDDEDETEAA